MTGRRDSRRYLIASLIGILLLGFLVRINELGEASYWLDEVHSYQRATQESWASAYQMLRRANHAPLYDIVVLHYWIKIGANEFLARFPTILLAVLGIAAVYLLGQRLFSARVGKISALLLAVAPLHVYYSRAARMYILGALWTTLALHFLWAALYRSTSTAKWRHWTGYTLTAAAGLYTHYYTGFTFLAVGVLLAARAATTGKWRVLRSLVLAQVAVGVLFTPWLPTFVAQLQGNPVRWIQALTSQRLARVLTRFFARPEFLGPGLAAVQLAAILLLAGGLLAHIRRRRLSESSAASDAYLLIAAAALGPIAISVLVSMFKPFLVDRYLVFSVPPACILVSLGVTRLRPRCLSVPMGLILLAGMMISAYGVATTRWRNDWRGAAEYIREHSLPGDIIMLFPAHNTPAFLHYYAGEMEPRTVPQDPANEDELKQALANLRPFARVWIVVSQRYNMNPAVTAQLETAYVLAHCRAFGGVNGLDICLYLNDTF